MAKSDIITPEILRQLLRYEPETGKLYWLPRGPEWFRDGPLDPELKVRRWNVWRAGKEALTAKGNGYLVGTILFQKTNAHRVIWALHYGRWPAEQIDHINGHRDDNRISNLREVTDGENKMNMKRRVDNKSGVMGVYWWPSSEKWRVQIRCHGKRYHVGMFDTKQAAITARKAAEKRLGFHKNHGRIA